MEKLAAVRFNNVGKYYYFSTELDLHKGDQVVVETVRGLELGELIFDLKDMADYGLQNELKPIKRKANQADKEVYGINQIKAERSFKICKEIIAESGIEMRLINCEYTLDASKVIFMYTADERVDFRGLLKKLASVFKCRIELRQVGPRDKAKIVGGIGTCGLPLCCNSFLGEFDGVSINMAKNQLLAINIDKISGACGRLLCCLKYEDEAYKIIKKKFPKIGSRVTYDGHTVKVIGLNVISDLVKIEDEGNIVFVSLDEYNQHTANGVKPEKETVKNNDSIKERKETKKAEEKPKERDNYKRKKEERRKSDRPRRSPDKKASSDTRQPKKRNNYKGKSQSRNNNNNNNQNRNNRRSANRHPKSKFQQKGKPNRESGSR